MRNCQALIIELEHSIQALSSQECPVLLGDLERLKAMTWTKVFTPVSPTPAEVRDQSSEQYLTVAEVIDRFKVTAPWLYRHKKQLPHSQPSRKVLLFPASALEKWFAGRKRA